MTFNFIQVSHKVLPVEVNPQWPPGSGGVHGGTLLMFMLLLDNSVLNLPCLILLLAASMMFE